jgi:hypothetical protein
MTAMCSDGFSRPPESMIRIDANSGRKCCQATRLRVRTKNFASAIRPFGFKLTMFKQRLNSVTISRNSQVPVRTSGETSTTKQKSESVEKQNRPKSIQANRSQKKGICTSIRKDNYPTLDRLVPGILPYFRHHIAHKPTTSANRASQPPRHVIPTE